MSEQNGIWYLVSTEQNGIRYLVSGTGIWSALNKIQKNTDELLKENRALRNLYNELQKSLEFYVSKVESLETKNEELKTEVNSLKRAVRTPKTKSMAFIKKLMISPAISEQLSINLMT